MTRTHADDQMVTATMLPTKRRLYLTSIEHMPRTAKPFVFMLCLMALPLDCVAIVPPVVDVSERAKVPCMSPPSTSVSPR